ncbi:MAG: sigma-70 family RNA polymerase sigma factor [Candidatus Krumholzibacteriota bacterium]|nr:sigma-70 family RNA polymerase sigma factor [Candidatus Krumholzibacteriota bacterium]
MTRNWQQKQADAPRSDESLILAVQEGDKRAYDELVRRYKVRLYNFLLRMLADPELAEELTQDALVRAYLNADKYRTIARFSTWLYTIAINLVRNQARRRKRSPVFRMPLVGRSDGEQRELEAPDMSRMPDRDLETKEEREHIQETVMLIPPHYREPFVLREFHDLSYEEIAAATGLKLGTVRSRINRARSHFRDHWVARFHSDEATREGGPLR